MVCGGSTDLLFTPLPDARPLQAALERLRQHGDGLFCLPRDGGAPYLAAQDGGGQSGQLELPLLDPGRVFVIGGGHVAREVARLLEQLDYRYLVADDRPDYADPDCFPAAERVVCTGFDALGGAFPGKWRRVPGGCRLHHDPGHAGDGAAVRWALGTGAGYIGLMGSRRKREKLFAELAAEGYADAPGRIVTPSALPSGGDSAEIAVSVCAQLIGWRHRMPSKTANKMRSDFYTYIYCVIGVFLSWPGTPAQVGGQREQHRDAVADGGVHRMPYMPTRAVEQHQHGDVEDRPPQDGQHHGHPADAEALEQVDREEAQKHQRRARMRMRRKMEARAPSGGRR